MLTPEAVEVAVAMETTLVVMVVLVLSLLDIQQMTFKIMLILRYNPLMQPQLLCQPKLTL